MSGWDWTFEHWDDLRKLLTAAGMMLSEGTAEVAFLRPNDEKMVLLEAGHVVSDRDPELDGYLHGPHVWIFVWKGSGNLRDNLKLAKRLKGMLGPNGRGGGRDAIARKLLNRKVR